jgi:hypothetical protein
VSVTGHVSHLPVLLNIEYLISPLLFDGFVVAVSALYWFDWHQAGLWGGRLRGVYRDVVLL